MCRAKVSMADHYSANSNLNAKLASPAADTGYDADNGFPPFFEPINPRTLLSNNYWHGALCIRTKPTEEQKMCQAFSGLKMEH